MAYGAGLRAAEVISRRVPTLTANAWSFALSKAKAARTATSCCRRICWSCCAPGGKRHIHVAGGAPGRPQPGAAAHDTPAQPGLPRSCSIRLDPQKGVDAYAAPLCSLPDRARLLTAISNRLHPSRRSGSTPHHHGKPSTPPECRCQPPPIPRPPPQRRQRPASPVIARAEPGRSHRKAPSSTTLLRQSPMPRLIHRPPRRTAVQHRTALKSP